MVKLLTGKSLPIVTLANTQVIPQQFFFVCVGLGTEACNDLLKLLAVF